MSALHKCGEFPGFPNVSGSQEGVCGFEKTLFQSNKVGVDPQQK